MGKLKAIVFDLDDTLYPEADFVLSGFKAVADWAGVHLGISAKAGFLELKQLFDEGVRVTTFDKWLHRHGLSSQNLITMLVDIYREHRPELRPFPEVPPLLEKLRRQGLRLGLVSDGHVAVQRRKLTALKIGHHFDAIVFSDELGKRYWKPSPKPFATVLKILKTKAGHSVYVGDNPTKDFRGARQVGMLTIRFSHPLGEYSQLIPPTEEHASHLTVTSLRQIEGIIAGTSMRKGTL